MATNEWAGLGQRIKEFQAENAKLKEALREAIFCRSFITKRCTKADPAGNDYEIDFSDDVKRWAMLCGLDLEKHDPFFYAR